jgi:hypothetical protein
MEGTDATVVPASRTGNLHIPHGNRRHIRVSVHGNELELTDERVDNNAAPINVHEIISAFTGVLKATANSTPIDTRIIAGNLNDSGYSTQNQEFKAEIMRLQQLVRKREGEIIYFKQLLQETKKDNEELKIRFRSATHMKAAELARQLSQVNTVHSATDGRGTEGILDLVEPFTPEQKPTEFILNHKVKEIDFFSLDDILDKDDAVYIPSTRTAEDISKGYHKDVTNNSGSLSGTVSTCQATK